MPNSINTITVSGYLGKAPELKEFSSGTQKATFSVALSEPVKTNDGWDTKTTWISVEFWGKDAEFLDKYANKGSFIVVSGRIATDSWEKDGETKYKTYIKGQTFSLPRMPSIDNEREETKSNVLSMPKQESVPF